MFSSTPKTPQVLPAIKALTHDQVAALMASGSMEIEGVTITTADVTIRREVKPAVGESQLRICRRIIGIFLLSSLGFRSSYSLKTDNPSSHDYSTHPPPDHASINVQPASTRRR